MYKSPRNKLNKNLKKNEPVTKVDFLPNFGNDPNTTVLQKPISANSEVLPENITYRSVLYVATIAHYHIRAIFRG